MERPLEVVHRESRRLVDRRRSGGEGDLNDFEVGVGGDLYFGEEDGARARL